jgi:hypothetical protein
MFFALWRFFSRHPAAPLHQGTPFTPVQPSNYSYSINSFWWHYFLSWNFFKLIINLSLMWMIYTEFFPILLERYMYDNFHFFKSKAKNLIHFSTDSGKWNIFFPILNNALISRQSPSPKVKHYFPKIKHYLSEAG